jgi:hypothetical protein
MKIRLALASTAVVLVAAVIVYFAARTPQAESARMAAVEPLAVDVELVGPALEDPATEAVRRSLVAKEPPGAVPAVTGTNVLRVVLEGITEEDAGRTRVTLTGVDYMRDEWPTHIQSSWLCQGLTSEFDLDPFLASVAEERHWNLTVAELELKVYHPLHLIEIARVPLSRGVELKSGQTLYEVRVRLVPGVPHVYWPELTLAVRDAHTREHLEDVELRCVPTAFMGSSQVPGTGAIFTSLGSGLSSPIVLLGGREAGEPEDLVGGLALGPAAGGAPQLLELVQPEATDRGVLVYARAPGYAWGTIVLDVSTGAERELLLGPAAALDVQLANVQLERYAELETEATLSVVWLDPRGSGGPVWSRRLDETLETEGLRLEVLVPGEYAVSVNLGDSWRKRPVLVAREEVSLVAGETRELVLALKGPPAPTARATLGGVVSFPAPTATWGGEEVRLQFYGADYMYGDADVELSLADLERVGGALPTWSFHLEDLPVGLYQVQLLPFLKNWMIELPAGGREDVELVVPELAEVLVETVDARTGERVPLEEIRYGYREDLQGQVHHDRSTADRPTVGFEGEPGRFRFWTAPGAAYVSTWKIPSGLDYGDRWQDLVLLPGLQSVRLELELVYTIRIEFRDGGGALPRDDGIWVGLSQGIRAVDHEGPVTVRHLQSRLVEVSAPGLYEISFEGIGADRFLPIPTRLVDVRAGETAEVIVELRRK